MSEEYEQYREDNAVSFEQFYEKEEDFNKKLEEIINKVLEQGQLVVTANKQMGKTNAMMWLMRKIMQMKGHEENRFKSIIFDLPLVWRFRFDKIPFVDHSKVSYIPVTRDLIVDLPYIDSVRTRNAISELLIEDFIRKRKIKEKFEGIIPFTNIYIIEECQNVFGSYSLNGSMGQFNLKIFSECANYGMVVIASTQRLADVSTKIVGRSKYVLVGSLQEDNDLKKIRKATTKEVSEKAKTLTRGKFIFWDRDNPEYIDMIYFPKFEADGKPYLFENGENKSGYTKRIFLSS